MDQTQTSTPSPPMPTDPAHTTTTPAPVTVAAAPLSVNAPPESSVAPSQIIATTPAVPEPVTSTAFEQQNLDGAWSDILTQLIFRLGFASIFLINAIVATLHPEDFVGLLENNIIASRIGHYSVMMNIAMINDLLLGSFILLGKYKRLVYPWAGLWLLMIAGMKLMNIVF